MRRCDIPLSITCRMLCIYCKIHRAILLHCLQWKWMQFNEHLKTRVLKALPAKVEKGFINTYVFQTFQVRSNFTGTKPQFAEIFWYYITKAQIIQNRGFRSTLNESFYTVPLRLFSLLQCVKKQTVYTRCHINGLVQPISLWSNPPHPRRTWYNSCKGGPLIHGSWWGNIVNRKLPRGGGFLSINMWCHFRTWMLFQSSKLKSRMSLFTETWQNRRSSFELWAFKNDTPSGMSCKCFKSFPIFCRGLIGFLGKIRKKIAINRIKSYKSTANFSIFKIRIFSYQ